MPLSDIFVPRPLQRPTLASDPNPESRLTPQQLFGLQYSRDRYADNSYQRNPDGVTSFMGAIDQAPDGSYLNYPTFWRNGADERGRVIPRAEALARALQYEQQTGKQFARYPTPQAAEWGEMQAVHPIMDQDSIRMMLTPRGR